MRYKTYAHALKHKSSVAIKLWRHLPELLISLGNMLLAFFYSIGLVILAIAEFLLCIVGPALVLVTPITAWIHFRIQKYVDPDKDKK